MGQINIMQFSVWDSGTEHVSRLPFLSMEDAKKRTFHSVEALSENAVQTMVNSLNENRNSPTFRIVWEPPEAYAGLMNGLKATKKAFKIRIYWIIKDGNTVKFSRTATFDGGKINKPALKKGRAMQEVEFAATSLSSPPT